MGSWVSKDGVHVPAQEEVALKDKDGKPYIYKGADRSATEYLKEQGVDHLGSPWWEYPDMIARVRQVHNCSMDEYKKMTGYDEATTKEIIEKNLKEVTLHSDSPRKPGVRPRSGPIEGAFGDKEEAYGKVKK